MDKAHKDNRDRMLAYRHAKLGGYAGTEEEFEESLFGDSMDAERLQAVRNGMDRFRRRHSGRKEDDAERPVTGMGSMYRTASELAQDDLLAPGDVCQTAGYAGVGDGGAAMYVIEEEPYLWGSVEIQNGLYANLVDRTHVSAIALGCRPGGQDNGPILEKIAKVKRSHAHLSDSPLTIRFPAGFFVFSPVKFDCPGIFIEGSCEPGELSPAQSGSTTFAPAGDQEYIIQFGRDEADLYGAGYSWMYQSGGMKNIRFTTHKWMDEQGSGIKHNFEITKACLVIGRRCYSWFDKLMFREVRGTCIHITASYEIVFGSIYMYHIFAPDHGALHFGYDIGNSGKGRASNNSALYFEYLAMEAVVGDPIQFAGMTDAYNIMFNVINYEDYRLDWGGDRENSWGCPWTDKEWLPEGYTQPDAELGLIHFLKHCSSDGITINHINIQNMSFRSYTLESNGLVYAHDALVLVDPDVFTWSLSIGFVDIHVNSCRAPFKPLICRTPEIGRTAHLYIGNLYDNNCGLDMTPDGYVRDYDVTTGRIGRKTVSGPMLPGNPPAPAYHSVYACTVLEEQEISWVTMEKMGTHSPWDSGWLGHYQPLGKGSGEAYSRERVCALLPSRKYFPEQGAGTSPVRIPVTGDLLCMRVYIEAYDSVVGAVNSLEDGSRLSNFNLKEYRETGWQWIRLDLSAYRHKGYVTFYMRRDTDCEAMLDVFYWE